uniref:Uncharacterized protein n=1 Tax=Lepeophtheirus salmonis TaxID=72036 RepID=A0A0K2T1H3_LEPSM
MRTIKSDFWALTTNFLSVFF